MPLRFYRRVSLNSAAVLIQSYRGPLRVLAFRAAAGQSQTPSEVNLARQYNA
jgi:hypothetical protein